MAVLSVLISRLRLRSANHHQLIVPRRRLWSSGVFDQLSEHLVCLTSSEIRRVWF